MLSIGEREKVGILMIICVYHFLKKLTFCSFFFLPLPCSSLEGSVIQISDQGLRKVLYQKVYNISFYSL